MGLLEDLAGAAAGQVLGGGSGGSLLSKLAPVVLGMVAGGGAAGGLGGLLNKFNGAGMQDQAQSWVSNGDNQPISADQVTQALGHDEVARVAQEAGVSHEEAAGGLAQLLPEVVNKVTSGGQVPDQGGLTDQLGQLAKMLGH